MPHAWGTMGQATGHYGTELRAPNWIIKVENKVMLEDLSYMLLNIGSPEHKIFNMEQKVF